MNQDSSQEPDNRDAPPQRPSFARIVLSTLAAAFGVQSNRNRQHDFQQQSILPYVVAGVVFTAVFVFALVFIVSLIIE